MDMHTRNYYTRQCEICAEIEAQPWCVAKAKREGFPPSGESCELWGSQDQACALTISFHFITVWGCAAGQELNQVFHVKSDWCEGYKLTAVIWGNIPDSPCSPSSHKPPLVLGNYLESAWLRKGGTHLGMSNISQEKIADAYPAIKENFESDYCLFTGAFHYKPYF